MSDNPSLIDLDRMIAIARYPFVLSAALTIDLNDSANGGRPRDFEHPFPLFLIHCIIRNVYQGRARHAIKHLQHPLYWQHLQDAVRDAYPLQPEVWLPGDPPSRAHYLYFRDTYLASDESIRTVTDELDRSGLNLARTLGLCQPGPVSWIDPLVENIVEADCTVVRSASQYAPGSVRTDPKTKEDKVRRSDPDERTHKEGGSDKPVRGHKFLIPSTRGVGYYRRAILGLAPAYEGSEMDALLPILERLSKELSITNLLYDAAARGNKINEIMRRFGIIVIAPCAADKRTGPNRNDRIERRVPVEFADATNAAGRTRRVDVWAERGMAMEAEIAADGTRMLTSLRLKRLHRRGSSGSFRLYGEFETEDGFSLRLRLFQNSADLERKFNRCEYLRAFGMDSPQYERLYGRRSDTESTHRQLKDALWQKRAGGYGRQRVHADLLAWCLSENAVADFIAKRTALDTSAATDAA